MSLSFEELTQLGDVFFRNGWPTLPDKTSPYPLLFDTTALMLGRLLPNERQLVLRLLSRYRWILQPERNKLWWHAWDKLEATLGNATCVVVAPLIKPSDEQPKSSGAVYQEYVVGNRDNLRRRLNGAFQAFPTVEMANEYCGSTTRRTPPVLVLVDDYVGSGETAITRIQSITGSIYSRIVVLAFAAQRAAIEAVSAVRGELLCGLELDRGISDHEENSSEMLGTMLEIEQRLLVSEQNRFGRGRAEATVTVYRTPNNTFPVFWTNKRVKGVPWDAPFPR